jgi:hypothetical protein
MASRKSKLDWLEEFERLADEVLSGRKLSPPLEHIQPRIKAWYEATLDQDHPDERPTLSQALACLATEIMTDMPTSLFEALVDKVEDDTVADWILDILMLGRAFEKAVQNGTLDEL